jgi:HTH-type transcriptional regulator/antitoxin HigA
MKAHKILKTDADYNAAIDRTIEIFDAEPGNPKFDELELLLVLIKDYEDKHYQIHSPDPIEAIKFKMEEAGLKNKDLIPIIGSEGHVSAILSGKRKLTLEMAKDINEILGIPAEILLSASIGEKILSEDQSQKSKDRAIRLKELSIKLQEHHHTA